MRHLIREAVRKGMGWLASLDLFVLLAALTLAGSVWLFLTVANEVVEGETHRIDQWLLLSLRNPDDSADPVGPPWMEEVGRDLTALGGIAVLTLITLTVVGYLFLAHKHHAALFVLGAVVGGLLLSTLLKGLFARPRPDLVPHLSHVSSSSFPSGHSMLSAVVYLTLGTLLARLARPLSHKVFFVAVALLLSLLVGMSRVYLGVHYPTDVVAGWTAGLAWAVLCWLTARYLQRRGAVEAPE
jgi:undecaprenyl-diphosphatase